MKDDDLSWTEAMRVCTGREIPDEPDTADTPAARARVTCLRDERAPVPDHVAIIMDGNGRWAEARGLPRALGHRKGVEAVRRTVRHAIRRGIPYLTLFAFSRENWRRPAAEIAELMGLVQRYVDTDLAELVEAGVRVRVIGRRADLSENLRATIERAERHTNDNAGMTLQLAFNYSGREDILQAVRSAAAAVTAAQLAPEAVDEALFASFLETAAAPDPDLLIRTSGEQRLSNFLLWQCAYAEFIFMDVLWPEFDERCFEAALDDFRRRQRRFGAVPAV